VSTAIHSIEIEKPFILGRFEKGISTKPHHRSNHGAVMKYFRTRFLAALNDKSGFS